MIRKYWQSHQFYKLLRTYLKGQRQAFLGLSICIVGGIVIQIMNPQIIRDFIDTALSIQQNEQAGLLTMALLFFGLAILQQGLAALTTFLAQTIGWQATNQLKEDLVAHALRLDMGYFKTIRQGEIIEIIEGDVNVLFNFFSRMVILFVSNLLLLCGVLYMYFREDYRIGLSQSLFVIIAYYLTGKIKAFGSEHWKENRQRTGRAFGYAGEMLQNTEDIQACGAGHYVRGRFQTLLDAWLPVRLKAGLSGWSYFMLSMLLQLTSFGISLLMGTWLWEQGLVSVGTIYMFYAYTNHLNRPIEAIQRQLQEIQTVTVSLERIQDILDRDSVIQEPEQPKSIYAPIALRMENVSFAYEPGTPVLENLSIALKPGQCLGVIGRTGSGKTTLAKLLMRLHDADTGQILLNDVPIKSLSLASLRKRVAYVTQDVQLFSGTIRENLTFFDKAVADDVLLSAVEAMGMSAWFAKYPEGFDTRIGTGGVGLSAGEAQLLAFVRVFLTNPDIVILDEVSSRLDPETERQLQVTIQRLLRNRIGIVIAHKLWTLEQADDILVLERGQVLEYGKRALLIKDRRSRYSQLLEVGTEEVLA